METMDMFDVNDIDIDFTIKKQLVFRIRKLASLDRIKLDISEHNSGLNLHLLKYLEYCGKSPKEYIRDYLKHLQPFMIEEFKSQEFNGAICILDNLYRISVYIKIDTKKGEEIIVSFHENNKNGVARKNSSYSKYTHVYVIPDSIEAVIENTDHASIRVLVTRGIGTFPIIIGARRYDADGFLVQYNVLSSSIVDFCNAYLDELYAVDTSLDVSKVQPFTALQQVSFTSFGRDKLSSISLLMDSILNQSNDIAKTMADTALCIYCQNLILLDSERDRFIEILKERYKVYADYATPILLDRVIDNL